MSTYAATIRGTRSNEYERRFANPFVAANNRFIDIPL